MPTLTANGIDMYYEVTGSGPSLTLIMGLGCSARQWQWMIPVLAETFQVISFDNRGVGRSGKPDMDYSTELFADDTRAMLEALEIEKTHLMGISVGGMIAQQVALKYPEMVDRLVLGCTMPNFSHHPASPQAVEDMQSTYFQSLEEAVDTMMALFLTENYFLKNPKHVAELKEVMMLEREEQGTDALLQQMGASINHDTLEDIHKITMPTLVMTGEWDAIAPVANARFLAETIPNSTLVEIQGLAHAFWVERFEESCRIVKDFLDSDSP